jgi:hypothetical protein
MPLNINKYKIYSRVPVELENLVTLPAGYYKVFRYTNFFPDHEFANSTSENDKIVVTVNTINGYLKNNFCLLIRLPNNCAVEDKLFVDLSSDNKQYYYNDSNYMCNMGNNFTEIYLVVSDIEGKLYETTNNIIYAYKLFDQYNAFLNLNNNDTKYKIKINCFISSYLNFYQIAFNFIIFNNYFEKNSLLYLIQKTNLEIHNIDNLKDIVYYDFLRFDYQTDLNKIIYEYKNYDIAISRKLADNKRVDNINQQIINNLVYIFNTNKIILLCRKMLSYLILIENYQFEKNYEYLYLINFINYNALECLNITLINYELDTNYCINVYNIQDMFGTLKDLQLNVTLQNVAIYIADVNYMIEYFKTKVSLTIEDIYLLLDSLLNLNKTDDEYIISFISEVKMIIENYTLNLVLFDSIESNINNQYNENLSIFLSNMLPGYTKLEIKILITSIINLVKIIFYNSDKLDNLINTLRLIYFDDTLDGIFENKRDNVVKNTFIYDTSYYNNILQIQNFDFNKFLFDLATVITNFSDPNINPQSYLIYQKVISENIIVILNNTSDIFNKICIKLIGIYKLNKNIDIGVIPKFDIYIDDNISSMYYLLTIFRKNLLEILKIITDNDILLFLEFLPEINYMINFSYSISEYLYYVQLQLIFIQFNDNTLIGSTVFIPEDILKILNIDEIYKIFKSIIENIDILIDGTDQNLINEILDFELQKSSNINLINQNETLKDFIQIVKKFKFGNRDINNLLKSYILQSYVVVNKKTDYSKIINKFDKFGKNIVILQDFNILYDNFSNSSFNFDKKLIKLINDYNNYKISTLNYYYQTSDINFSKQLINYNY